ncbi:MAG: ABC transporter permease [Burkholderiales bacterium]|nr:ABC transporter permease [Burkholderiales bacterium]
MSLSPDAPTPLDGVAAAAPAAWRAEVARWTPSLWVGAALLLGLVLAGIGAPWLTPWDPLRQDYGAALQAPSAAHWFGTDSLGRDVFARALYAIRIDLAIGFWTTYVPMAIGVLIGAYAGLVGGLFDTVLMRVIDVALALPFLVLIIVILAILGPGTRNIYIAVFLVGWTMYARLARAEMLVEREKDYLLAARTLGYSRTRVLLRHALPNILNASIVFSVSDFILNILLVSGLSFLGLGVPPPTPEWGAMVADGKAFMQQAWWIATLPGLVIVLTGVALSLIGDGLTHRLGDRHVTGH